MPQNIPSPGLYVLTQGVTNPQIDMRRSTRYGVPRALSKGTFLRVNHGDTDRDVLFWAIDGVNGYRDLLGYAAGEASKANGNALAAACIPHMSRLTGAEIRKHVGLKTYVETDETIEHHAADVLQRLLDRGDVEVGKIVAAFLEVLEKKS